MLSPIRTTGDIRGDTMQPSSEAANVTAGHRPETNLSHGGL
jgi:hypothetical protein